MPGDVAVKHEESSLMGEVYLALCESVNSPISLGCWLRFKHNQLALANFDLPVRDYQDRVRFEQDYLVASYLSKYKGLKTDLDLEAEALQRFKSSEQTCRLANSRLKSCDEGLDPFLSEVFHLAQRKIASLLGPFSYFCVSPWLGWGPGATDDVPRRKAYLDTKLCEVPFSCSRSNASFVRSVIETDLHWSSVILQIGVDDIHLPYSLLPTVFLFTDSCAVDTVAKNAKTHRVIAKEPRLNSFVQKGFGGWFRRRLKRVGVDLDDQGPNQRGASRAYKDGLSTLDLKAASDSMCKELVFKLLPIEWALALDDCRSKYATLPSGEVVHLEKFSSMGNGFTFELESLIFWALVSAVKDACSVEGEILIYGDDIICPHAIASKVIDVLGFCGFSTNEAKSYVSGNFFESCGKHYFKGVDVTPIFQKERIEFAEELIRAANRLIRLADRFSDSKTLYPEVKRSWSICYQAGKAVRQFQIPLGVSGDDAWVVPADYFKARPSDPNFGIQCKVFRSTQRRLPAVEGAYLAWALRSNESVGDQETGLVDVIIEPKRTDSCVGFWPSFLSEATRWVMPTGDFGLSW